MWRADGSSGASCELIELSPCFHIFYSLPFRNNTPLLALPLANAPVPLQFQATRGAPL
jgi:hypothetical protein